MLAQSRPNVTAEVSHFPPRRCVPGQRRFQAALKIAHRLIAQRLFDVPQVRQRVPHIARPRRLMHAGQVRTGVRRTRITRSQLVRRARRWPAGDVEHVARPAVARASRGEQIRVRRAIHKREIARLLAVAENDRLLPRQHRLGERRESAAAYARSRFAVDRRC